MCGKGLILTFRYLYGKHGRISGGHKREGTYVLPVGGLSIRRVLPASQGIGMGGRKSANSGAGSPTGLKVRTGNTGQEPGVSMANAVAEGRGGASVAGAEYRGRSPDGTYWYANRRGSYGARLGSEFFCSPYAARCLQSGGSTPGGPLSRQR